MRPIIHFPNLGHQLPVLSMYTAYGSDVLTVLQGLEQLAVPQHVHVLVSHVHLEGVHSFFSHQCLHLSPHLVIISYQMHY